MGHTHEGMATIYTITHMIALELDGLDEAQRKRFEQRLERYARTKEEQAIHTYIKKLNKEAAELGVHNRLQAQLEAHIGSTYLPEAMAELEQGKYIDFWLKGDPAPFERLLHHFQNLSTYTPRLIHSDFRTADIADASIDVIVTDPPYPKEFLPLYGDLVEFAARVLKPGGSLLAMAGQSWLPEIYAQMTGRGLDYNWTLSYLTPGGQSPQIWPRKVNAFWKPVLWYIKGKPNRWVGDVVKSAVNDNDKRFHFWGQSESGMANLIAKVSMAGDTILDPFMGGGTTGIIALKMRRKFIGIELSADAFQTASARFEALE